jgi:hypothetical protein
MSKRFEYGTACIKDIVVPECTETEKETEKTAKKKRSAVEVLLDGEPLQTTKRFWNSLHHRFGFTSNIFRYFSPAEVFARISEVAPNDEVRWCVERDGEEGKLLAVTNPGAALIKHDDLMELLDQYDASEIKYTEGMVSSCHAPRLSGTFKVAGDGFQNRFIIDTPIDGYGRPSVYVSLLRLVCSNGAVGYTPAFRSELSVGRGEDGVAFALTRVLDGFNNEDGFIAMRQRFESAAKSWASVNEVNKLYKLLARLHHRGEIKGRAPIATTGSDGASECADAPLFHAFHKMTGDLTRIYGMANLDALSVKRQRTLPTACRVYDLLNFASEVATHHATEAGDRIVQAYIGDLISSEFDLEGTVDQFSDWRDFFIGSDATTTTMADLNRRGG